MSKNFCKNNKSASLWLSLAHMIQDMYSGFLNPIMPFIAAKLGITMGVATLIMSVSHMFSSLIQPIFGFFADNILKRAFIFWGLLLGSVFVSFAPLAHNVYVLLLFIIFGSLGGSLFHPQATGFALRFGGSDSARSMGIFMSMGSIGFSFGPLIAAWITQYCGMQNMPYTSVLGLIWAFLMFIFVPKLSIIDKKPEYKKFRDSFVEILSNRVINYLMIISMMKTLVTNSCCILLPFLWKDMGYGAFFIGVALFGFIFMGGLGSLFSRKFEIIFGTKNLLYISLIATLPLMGVFVLTYKTFPIVAVIIFMLMGFVTMLAQPVTMVMGQKLLPQYKSIIAGFMNGFSWGVVAICLTGLGFVAQKFGITNVLMLLSFAPAFSAYFVKFLDENYNN